MAFNQQVGKILEGLFCAWSGNFPLPYQAPQNLRDFNVEQLRGVHLFRPRKSALHQSVRAVRAQQNFEQRRGINHDQRLSRSARSNSVGLFLPR